MKKINQFITEKFKINSKTAKKNIEYNYHPKTNEELIQTVYRLIQKRGKDADLNDIDTSGIINMDSVFADNDVNRSFNGDISKWNVSKVTNMGSMFFGSEFNGDISDWDVSNVTNMYLMFNNSKFDGDLSRWDVSNVTNMAYMFAKSEFTGKNGDISNWDIRNVKSMLNMFKQCPLEKNPPKWYHE